MSATTPSPESLSRHVQRATEPDRCQGLQKGPRAVQHEHGSRVSAQCRSHLVQDVAETADRLRPLHARHVSRQIPARHAHTTTSKGLLRRFSCHVGPSPRGRQRPFLCLQERSAFHTPLAAPFRFEPSPAAGLVGKPRSAQRASVRPASSLAVTQHPGRHGTVRTVRTAEAHRHTPASDNVTGPRTRVHPAAIRRRANRAALATAWTSSTRRRVEPGAWAPAGDLAGVAAIAVPFAGGPVQVPDDVSNLRGTLDVTANGNRTPARASAPRGGAPKRGDGADAGALSEFAPCCVP
jgi:hypothetical protein